jgi:acyl carrier protein
MVPERFILVKNIPLTSNGKVDRKALAHMEITGTGTGKDYVSPGDEVEYQIARVWEEVLELDRVGRNDNFFELGGNSLDIIRIVEKLKPLLGIDIAVTTLFEYPTLGVFSEFLKKGRMDVDSALEQEQQGAPVMDESRRATREWAKTTREKQQNKRQRRFQP